MQVAHVQRQRSCEGLAGQDQVSYRFLVFMVAYRVSPHREASIDIEASMRNWKPPSEAKRQKCSRPRFQLARMLSAMVMDWTSWKSPFVFMSMPTSTASQSCVASWGQIHLIPTLLPRCHCWPRLAASGAFFTHQPVGGVYLPSNREHSQVTGSSRRRRRGRVSSLKHRSGNSCGEIVACASSGCSLGLRRS